MNRRKVISALIALTLSTWKPSFAQGNSDHDERGRRQGRNPKRRGAAANVHDNRGFGRAHEQERSRGRGVGPNYEYYRGDRLPIEYRHRNYVVDDWRGHNLSAPPRGYHWVQSGSDYILVAIATGIILELLLDHR